MTTESRLKRLEAMTKQKTKKHIVWVTYKDLENGTPTDQEYDKAIKCYEETNNIEIAIGDDITFTGWGRKKD